MLYILKLLAQSSGRQDAGSYKNVTRRRLISGELRRVQAGQINGNGSGPSFVFTAVSKQGVKTGRTGLRHAL